MTHIRFLSLWTISFLQATLCLTPTTLVAIGHLQNQRVRALANALNLRARSQLARSRANLNLAQRGGEHRIIPRDVSESDENFDERLVPIDDEIVFQDANDVDDTDGNIGQDFLDERLGAGNPNFGQREGSSSSDVEGNIFGTLPSCPVCRYNIMRNSMSAGGPQSSENSVFTCPICNQMLTVVTRRFDNSKVDEIDLCQIDEPILQTSENEQDPSRNTDVISPENPSDDQRSASPHHHHHRGFIHTHTHIHEFRPLHGTPIEQIYPNKVPIHKYFGIPPTTTTVVQPGFHHHTSGAEHQNFEPTTFGGINTFKPHHSTLHPTIPNQEVIADQSQVINVNSHRNLPKNIVINQNQVINAKNSESPQESIIEESDPLLENLDQGTNEDKNRASNDETSNPDEIVSTFLPSDLYYDAPTYPTYPYDYSPNTFDPKKPQNKKNLVKYVEDEQKSIEEFLQFLRKKKHPVHTSKLYGYDKPIPKINDYHLPPNSYDQSITYHDTNPYGMEDMNRKDPMYFPEMQQHQSYPDQHQYQSYPQIFNENFESNFKPSTNAYNVEEPNESIPDKYKELSISDYRLSDTKPQSRENQFDEFTVPPLHFDNIDDAPNMIPEPQNPEPQPAPAPHETDSQSALRNYFENEQKNVQIALEKIQDEHKRNFENLVNSLRLNVPTQHAQNQDQETLGMINTANENGEEVTKSDEAPDSTLSHIFQVPFNPRVKFQDSKLNRKKRQIANNKLLDRLMNDPKVQLDVMKTLENFGAATKSTFERRQHPIYHLKKLLGSAKDAVMAALKIPNQPFLTPSSYDIVKRESKEQNVGDINPSIFSADVNIPKNSKLETFVEDNFGDTFQKVGSLLRNSIESGQATINHIGDVAKHSKDAVYNMRYVTPQVFHMKSPLVTKEQSVIITPRILEISENSEQVGDQLDDPSETNIVGMGDLFDATGISKPDTALKVQKITMEVERPDRLRQSQSPPQLGNIQIKTLGNVNDKHVENALNHLYSAQASLGVNNLKDLMYKLKGNIVKVLKTRFLGSKYFENDKPKEKASSKAKLMTERKQNLNTQNSNGYKVKNTDERVGASYIPEQLRHPFLNQNFQNQVQNFLTQLNNHQSKHTKRESYSYQADDSEPILGAINPMMFEKMVNETIKPSNRSQEILPSQSDQEGEMDETVSTMNIGGQLLKPYMGLPSSRVIHEFYEKYEPTFQENSLKPDLEPLNLEYELDEY